MPWGLKENVIEQTTEYQRHASWSHGKGLVEVVGFTWTLKEGRGVLARNNCKRNIKMADAYRGNISGKSMWWRIFFKKSYFSHHYLRRWVNISLHRPAPPLLIVCQQSQWLHYTVVLEKTVESPLDCKEIQPVHSKGDQLWVFIGRNDAKAETPIFWPPHAKSWLIGKDSDVGRD